MTDSTQILTILGTLLTTMVEMNDRMEKIQHDINKAKKSKRRKMRKKQAKRVAEVADQDYDEQMLEEVRAWNEEQDRQEYEESLNIKTIDFEENPTWRIKPFSNGGASKKKQALYEEWLSKCLEDSSIGIHYGVIEDLTQETFTREQLLEKLPKEGSHIHCKSSYRFMDMFLNEIKDGDVAIIGQGKNLARHLVKFVGEAYFDNSEMWTTPSDLKDGSELQSHQGFFHRRRFEYIRELPKDSLMSTPLIQTLGKYTKETLTQVRVANSSCPPSPISV